MDRRSSECIMLSLSGREADAEQADFDLADFLILLQFGFFKQSYAAIIAGPGRAKGNF